MAITKAQRLKKWMAQRGMTTKDLAELIQKDEKTVYGFLEGHTKFPTYLNLVFFQEDEIREKLDSFIATARKNRKIKDIKSAMTIKEQLVIS